MNRNLITFSANEQTLIKTGGINNYASNTVSYIVAEFDLGENWDEFDSVRAIFQSDFETAPAVLAHGYCVIPFEVLRYRSTVRVNLVGSVAEQGVLIDRLTTFPITALNVTADALVDNSIAPISPSEFEEFVAMVRDDADRAEAGAESAESSASAASTSAQSAEDSALSASNSASDASASAQTAQEEAQKITGMVVVVTQLPEGATPTSDWSNGVLTIGIPKGDTGETGATGNGIESAVLNANYTLTLTFTDGTSYTTPSIRGATGATGATGNGISSVTLTSTSGAVKTYTIAFTDGTNTTFDVTDGEVTQAVLDEEITALKAEIKGKETIKGTYQRTSLWKGNPSSANYRVSETDIVSYTHNLEVSIADGFRIGVHYFSSGVYSYDSGWQTNYYVIPANSNFKFVIARVTEDTSEIADINTFREAVTFKNVIGTNEFNITGLNCDMSASNAGEQTFRGHGNFQPYGLNGATFLYSQKYRVSNDDPMTFDEDLTISVKAGFRWGYVPFVGGSAGTWSGWFTTPTTIRQGTSFVAQIARVTEDTSEIADVNEFLNAVTFPNKAGENANDITALESDVNNLENLVIAPTEMPLEQGAIYGGADSASNNYARTQGYIYMPVGSKIKLGKFSGQLIYSFYYYNQAHVNGFIQSDPNGVTVNANNEAIYTTIMDGYVRLRVERGSSTALAPTDLSGVVTYETNQIEVAKHEVSLTSLFGKYVVDDPSFDSELLSFCALFNSNNADSFLFFTDPHIFGANGTYSKILVDKYMSAVQHCYYHSPCSFIVCGGDWLNNGDTASQAKFKLGEINGLTRRLFGNAYYPIVGNHDTNYLGSGNDYELSEQTIANLWNGERGTNYYTFKSPNARYYVLDTGEEYQTTMTPYRWEQIDWLAKELAEHDDTHNVVMFHILYLGSISTSVSTMAQNIGLLIQAYNSHTVVELNGAEYDFSQCNGKIDYSLVGHSHADFDATLGGVPIIGSINMQSGGTPSFDLIYVDYDAMTFNSVRVGTGNNRTIEL